MKEQKSKLVMVKEERFQIVSCKEKYALEWGVGDNFTQKILNNVVSGANMNF